MRSHASVPGNSLVGCLDGNLVLVPLVSRGIEKDNTASVHAGFLISYNSVRATVIRIVRGQLHAFPDYTVVITGTLCKTKMLPFPSLPYLARAFGLTRLALLAGHSLGGALASIAALSVKSNLPSATVRLFTYGASLSTWRHELNVYEKGTSTSLYVMRAGRPAAHRGRCICESSRDHCLPRAYLPRHVLLIVPVFQSCQPDIDMRCQKPSILGVLYPFL
jgi:Lipase (class 3)